MFFRHSKRTVKIATRCIKATTGLKHSTNTPVHLLVVIRSQHEPVDKNYYYNYNNNNNSRAGGVTTRIRRLLLSISWLL